MDYILFIAYFGLMNIAGFLTMGIDKSSAKRHELRISEKTLLIIAALGGAAGSWIGMELFRHKTKHAKFTVLVPLFLAIQLIAFFLLNMKYQFFA